MTGFNEPDKDFLSGAPGNAQVRELLRRRARERGLSARWNGNTLILAYVTLLTTMILAVEDVSIVIVSLVATFGLASIWAFSQYQARRMEQEYLKDELRMYTELLTTHSTDAAKPAGAELTREDNIPLTERELEVLRLVAEGKSNKEIAGALAISDQTVKNHISHVFSKLGVGDRTSAVLVSISRGWIKSNRIDQIRPMLDKED